MTLPTEVAADTRPPAWSAVRRDIPAFVPGAIIAGLWLVWVGASGGYEPDTWYPSALLVFSLWVAVLGFGERVLPAARPARIALLAFAGLVAFNYLSILWAAAKGNALAAANELALYLMVAWIFAVLRWTPRALAAVVAIWSVGVCAFCVVTLIHATSAATLTSFFVNGRFATPMQYSNATGALAVQAMWPALILSSRRELPFWLRALALGVATFLADFATLPQSRAALLGLILTAPLALAVGGDRIRLLTRMVVVGGALAICLPRTVSVDDAVNANANVTPVLGHAAAGMWITSLAAVAAGLILSLLEDRLTGRQARGRGRPARAGGAPRLSARAVRTSAAAGVVVVLAAGAVVAVPPAAHFVRTVVHSGNTDASTGSTRLLSTSPEERFDYDRVALHLFSGAPVLGIGSGNFGRRYDALRRFVKHSQYTHNLPLRVLSETGLVGGLLFVVVIAALVGGLVVATRGRNDLGRAVAVIALCVSGYFLVHSCLDWVDEFPALAAPAIALPLAALTAAAPRTTATRGPRSREWVLGRRLGLAAGAVAAAAVLVALGTSYLSLRLVDRAFAIFRDNPGQAYRDVSRAQSIDPLNANPITSEGTLALYLGDTARARRAFQRSVHRQDDWYPRVELALIDARAGRFAQALAQIDAAIALDAHDPVIDDARSQIATHHRLNPFTVNQQILNEGNVTSVVQSTVR